MYPRIEDKAFVIDALLRATSTRNTRRMALYVIYHTLHDSSSPPAPRARAALLKLRKSFAGLV